jgi:hypothetical protein
MIPILLDIDSSRSQDDLRPRLVSPAAKSVIIAIDQRPSHTIARLRAGQRGCNGSSEGLRCEVQLPLPYGHHRFTLSILDGDDGHGETLAVGSTPYLNDGAPREIALSLHGVLGGIRLRAHDPTVRLVAGHARDIAIDVDAVDHDGFPVLNTAPYLHPIVVTVRDPAGATALSTATIAAARTPLTLHYDGSPGSAVEIVASSQGIDDVRLVLPIDP